VSEATLARVMKAAQGLDYTPNAAARSLITRRSNLIAVIISNSANLHYPETLAELSREITRRGKRLLLFTLTRDNELDEVLSDIWNFQVDGVIAAEALSDLQVAEFERRRVPLVMFNRGAPGQAVNSVGCDQQNGARILLGRLAAAGHRQFALIGGAPDAPLTRQRLRGATERAAELGLPEPLMVHGAEDYASGGAGLRTIIARLGKLPDAVICGNDVIAVGCLDTARHALGIVVPKQMSVAGFDTLEPSGWISYNLTTLRQPIAQMARSAADLLAALIERNGLLAEQRDFSAQFIEGETARLV
jgi:DNA-binding LacI/PurR family transcriptional regulator